METKRSYRHVEPSDLPRIQSGKLKAFWQGGQIFPARLVSTRCGNWGGGTLWLYDNGNEDVPCNSNLIVVDVTPEKRYAVWSHAIQRFIYTNNDAGFTSRTAAECCIHDKKNCYVVEWEIRGNE
jgi:hypothetical protein